MNLELMNEKYKSCSCGKAHTCPIDYVKIGKGAIAELAELCKNYNNILLVSDINTYEVCGKNVYDILGKKVLRI